MNLEKGRKYACLRKNLVEFIKSPIILFYLFYILNNLETKKLVKVYTYSDFLCESYFVCFYFSIIWFHIFNFKIWKHLLKLYILFIFFVLKYKYISLLVSVLFTSTSDITIWSLNNFTECEPFNLNNVLRYQTSLCWVYHFKITAKITVPKVL